LRVQQLLHTYNMLPQILGYLDLSCGYYTTSMLFYVEKACMTRRQCRDTSNVQNASCDYAKVLKVDRSSLAPWLIKRTAAGLT